MTAQRNLRPYQQAAIAAIYRYFEERDGHPLVVIPTAGGKSIVLAAFIQGVLQQWPDQRILVVTHVSELIAQNHAEMMGLWPDAPAGIYSAGLARREIGARVLFAGIQSIHRRAYDVQQCDLVLIDEAHLIPRSSDTMYRRFIHTLSRINPGLKVIGFTATPYRLDSGMLHEGECRLFTDIAYEVSIRDLIDQGYLCPLISKTTNLTLDVGGVGTRGGEFIAGQLQAAVDREAITTCRDRRDPGLRRGSPLLAIVLFRRRACEARRLGTKGTRRQLRHDLRRHAVGRARPRHRRLQTRRDQGPGVDGRPHHRLQCAVG